VRCECVRAVRRCLDIATFQRRGGERRREWGRYCKDDAAKFAVRGEGHCHTVSSTMAAFLYPWSALLGLDLMYREDPGGHHQWLEFALRPAMRCFACDLYRDDTPTTADGRRRRDGTKLAEPIADAYAWGEDSSAGHPATRPKRLTDRPIRVAPLQDGDVAAALLGGGTVGTITPPLAHVLPRLPLQEKK